MRFAESRFCWIWSFKLFFEKKIIFHSFFSHIFFTKILPFFLLFLTIFDNKKVSDFNDKPLLRMYFDEISSNFMSVQKSATLHFRLLKKSLPIFHVWRPSRCANSILTSNLSESGSIVLRNIHPHNIITYTFFYKIWLVFPYFRYNSWTVSPISKILCILKSP